ncbi:MAG: phosphotyrosine protein phosphatase [Burkholderiales bacterium]|nr:phosphotyrosine protein phosphatase [Burkholderiales bacterium]
MAAMNALVLQRRTSNLVCQGFGTYRGLVRFLLGECEYVCGRIDAFVAPRTESVQRLVFVCLGNINRSAFAHAVGERLGARCASFGLASSSGQPAYPMAVSTARLFGIDLTEHRTTDMTDYAAAPGDLLVTMEIRHARRLVSAGYDHGGITLLGHWSNPHRVHIHDPHTLNAAYFKTCFTIIHSGVTNLVDYLRQGGSACVRP